MPKPVELVKPESLKEFFYGQIDDEKALDMLMFLYNVNTDNELFEKFKKEIDEIKKRCESELANTTDLLFRDDLKTQIDKLKNVKDNCNLNYIITYLRKKFKSNLEIHEEYAKGLCSILKKEKVKLKHLVIYEAPPFAGKYILESKKFDDPKISTYWQPIVDVLLKPNNKISPCKNMIDNKIGFIDLSLVPLPLKEIRGEWSTLDKYKFGDKQLPVLLFEWAIQDFIDKINGQIVSKPKIAIGIPNKTSISIFDYYSNDTFKYKGVTIDVSKENKKNEKSKYNKRYPEIFNALKSRTLRLNKTNVTSGSGFPNGLLMKMALQLNLK
jgi:hypothetical protein